MDSYVCGEIPTSEKDAEVYTMNLALYQVLNNIQGNVIPFKHMESF